MGSRRVSPGERLVWDRDKVCRQAWGWGCPSAPGWAPVSGVSRHPRRCAMACLSLRGCGGKAVEPLAAGACERPGYGNLRSALPLSWRLATHLFTCPSFCARVCVRAHVRRKGTYAQECVHACVSAQACLWSGPAQ